MDEGDVTSEVDHELRQEFNRLFTAPEQPAEVFDGLAPTFRRAQRVHQIKQTAVGLAAAVMLLGGTGLIVRSVVSDEAQITIAGEGENADADGQPDGDKANGEMAVTGTTIDPFLDSDGSSAADIDDGDSLNDDPSPSTEPDGDTTTTSIGSTSQGPSTSASPSTTSDMSSTSIAPDGKVTIYSDCGSIVVLPSEPSVQLIDVVPDSGYSQDVKSSGTEKVEVGFERDGLGHCEIEARFKEGRFDIDVEN